MSWIKGNIEGIKNIFYVYRLAWQYNKKYLFYLLLNLLLSPIDPFVLIIFPKLILDEITSNGSFVKIVLFSLSMVGIFFITKNGLTLAKQKGEIEGEALMIQLRLLCNKVNMTTAFENTENPEYLNMKERATQIIWNSTYFNTFSFSFVNLLSGLLQIIGIISLIIFLNPIIILILLILFISNLIYQTHIQKKNFKIDQETSPIRRKWSYLDTVVTDFKYGKMIRLDSISNWLINKATQNRTEFYNKQKDIVNNNTKVYILGSVIGCLQECGVYIYLIYQVIYSLISIGSFTMFLSAVNQFSASLSLLLNNITSLNKYSLYVDDFKNFLSLDSQDKAMEQTLLVLPELEKAPILEFVNVSFRYPRTEKWILQDINIKILPGEKISLVGDNGAGKTTLIKLILRLYEPTEGEILLNGINIHKINFSSYQRLFATVFQDYKVFAFTLAENIVMNQVNESDSVKLNNVISQSGLTEDIEKLPYEIDTYLGKKFEEEGIELSGGQQQKLTIARALYRNAHILILDEPTANLSPIAEHDLYEKYYSMAKEKTAIFVSHRLTSTRFSDKIVLLDQAKIAEYGDHEMLMKLNGLYANMFRLQAKYYEDEGN